MKFYLYSLFKSIRFQMGFFTTLFLVLLISFVGKYSIDQEKAQIADYLVNDFNYENRLLNNLTSHAVAHNNIEDIETYVSKVVKFKNYAYVGIFSRQGKALYSSGESIPENAIIDANHEPISSRVIERHLSDDPEHRILVINDLIESGKKVGQIKIVHDLTPQFELLQKRENDIFIFSIFTLCLSIILMTFLTQRINAPLERLDYFSKQIIAGNQDFRLSLPSTELAGIEASLNQMTDCLHEREALLELTIKSIADGVVVTDPLGNILRFNSTAERLIGVKEKDVLSHSVGEVMSFTRGLDDSPIVHPILEIISEPINKRSSQYLELIGIRNQKYKIRQNSSLLLGDGGEVLGAIMVFSDITDRVTLREKIEQQNGLLEMVIDNISDYIVACDSKGKITVCSSNIDQVIPELQEVDNQAGIECFELYNCLGDTLLSGEDYPLYRALNGGDVTNAEVTLKLSNNERRRLVVNGKQLLSSEGGVLGAVMSMNDITERVGLESEKQKQKEQISIINQLQSMCIAGDDETIIVNRMLNSISNYIQCKAINWFDVTSVMRETQEFTSYNNEKLHEINLTGIEGLEFFTRNQQAAQVLNQNLVKLRQSQMGGCSLIEAEESTLCLFPIKIDGVLSRVLCVESNGCTNKYLKPILTTLCQVLEAQQTQLKLADNEEHLRKSQFYANMGSWHRNVSTGVVYWSENIASMLGYSTNRIEPSFEAFINAIHPDDLPHVMNVIGDCLLGKKYTVEFRIKGKDGCIKWLEEMAKPVYSADGHLTHIYGMIRDITEKKSLQDQFVQQQALSHFTLEAMVDAVLTIDSKGKILSLNKSAESLFEYSSNELKGRSIATLVPEKHRDNQDLQTYFKVGSESINSFGHEVAALKNDGTEFPIWLRIAEISTGNEGNERYFVGTCHDLTEKKAQEELLKQTYKMDVLGKLTGGVAHDYNNMLGVIIGYSELIEKTLDPESDQFKQITQVITAANRSASLTKKLLNFSCAPLNEKSHVNINQLLNNFETLLTQSMMPHHQTQINTSSDELIILVNSGELEDALLNLALNAKHAMEKGGDFTIESSAAYLSNNVANEMSIEGGHYLQLKISDTGVGMDEETRSMIFEPFFTTKGEQGTGLGMSQVFGFISRSQGAIKVESTVGVGTTFYLYIPLDEENNNYQVTGNSLDAINEAAEYEQPTNICRENKTILVVDDEMALRELACDILDEYGYHVLLAENGEDALEVLKENEVDLVFSDILMPKLGGYELYDKVAHLYPHIPVLLTSGYSAEISSKNIDVLMKPYKNDCLAKRISELLVE